MESLSKCLDNTLRLRSAIECGESVRSGLNLCLNYKKHQLLSKWLFLYDQKQDLSEFYQKCSPYERSFFEIIRSGLEGNKIYDRLIELERELFQKCLYEIQNEIDSLPFKLLVPVMLFQFPAYLILILGPVMGELTRSMEGM